MWKIPSSLFGLERDGLVAKHVLFFSYYYYYYDYYFPSFLHPCPNPDQSWIKVPVNSVKNIFRKNLLFFFLGNFQHLMQQKILINQTHFLVFNFQYLDECGFIGSQVSTAKSSYISLTWHYRNLQSFLSKLNW